MDIIPIKTRVAKPPKDDFWEIATNALKGRARPREGDILFITSKLLAIHQGRCVKRDGTKKDDIIRREAEKYIPRNQSPGGHVILAIKGNTLIPSAGIDESNADNYFVLWPSGPANLAHGILRRMKLNYGIKNLAVVITDSHCVPLRRGVIGISIAHAGLNPLRNYIGRKDLFGRKLKMTQANAVDALSAMAVLAMGECDECTPMAIIRGAENIEFTSKNNPNFTIEEKEDIYAPILKAFKNKGMGQKPRKHA